ncbi:unnamed protein product [Adineta ricciae]|uniref:Uncharacterized protein n=1 Tax=Adineta ricciae TaxID=249248 RepID=A0A813MIR6_ADIRI|nr:unnamed protein product [Adineta ricciae]
MELYRRPTIYSNGRPSLQGDPATYRFALFLLRALAILTFGAVVGVIVGNAAHYEYYPANNRTTISSNDLWNISIFQ